MKVRFSRSTGEVMASDKAPFQRRRWDRWLYLVIFGLIVFYFLKWLLSPSIFSKAQGVLLQDHFDIQFSEDIRILQLNIEEDDIVQQGDTLFSYEILRGGEVMGFEQDSIRFILSLNNDKSNLIAIEAQIQKRQAFIIDLRKRLEYWNSERIKKEKLVYLGVITPNELANVDRSIDDVLYNLKSTEAELYSLKNQLEKLRKNFANNTNLGFGNIRNMYRQRVFVSPVSGKIDQLKLPEQSVLYRGDEITSIIQHKFHVKAFIEMTKLHEFDVGDHVQVILPYKHKKLKGMIARVYSISDLKYDVIIPDKYREQQYGGVIKIVPVHEDEWEDLYYSNIPVEVRKYKFK